MKIAQITAVYPPYNGGIGIVAQEYALALASDGEDVTVFTAKSDELGDSDADVKIRRLRGWYKWGHATLLPQLFWKLRSFDILHLHYPFYGAAIFTAVASIIWRKPLVITYHMKPVADGWLGWIFRLYRIFVEPFVFMAANVICASSLDYARAAGLKTRRLVELPFSVDTKRFAPGDAMDIREQFEVRPDSKLIIFVGGLDDAHYFKGVDVLLKACQKIKKEAKWDLVIVGDGNRRGSFEKMAKEMNLQDKVHFAGRVNNEDLPKFYQAADIHVLAAINRCEAFGLVTLEAGASGLPSIVTNLPGVRTLVDENETGLIVDPSGIDSMSQALEKLIIDDQKRYDYAQAARLRMEKYFSKEVIHEKLKEVYKGVSQ